MSVTEIPGTEKTPAVRFHPEEGLFELSGSSIHENAHAFYKPLLQGMAEYAKTPRPSTNVRISLHYFNSSSAKYILDLLKMLDEAHASGTSAVKLYWLHDVGDLDMGEAGRDYQELLGMDVEVLANPA